jgi:hypothetical protein
MPFGSPTSQGLEIGAMWLATEAARRLHGRSEPKRIHSSGAAANEANQCLNSWSQSILL